MDRRGLSDIVTNVLIILLVLVAVGIIWTFVNPLLRSPQDQLGTDQFSTSFEVVPSSVQLDTTANTIQINIKRNPGGGENAAIVGMSVILEDAAGNTNVTSYELSDFKELETRTISVSYGTVIGDPVKVSIVPLFDINGQERPGSIADTFVISTGQSSGSPDLCGNGQINSGEQCDGSNLNGESCTTLGFSGGSLSCSSCSFDTGSCTSAGDTTNPVITLVSPSAPGSPVYIGSPIDYDISDNVAVTTATYSINGGASQPFTSPYVIDTTGLSPSPIFVIINASDAAGNSVSVTHTFFPFSQIPTGYVGYWRFNGDFSDSSGNGLTGTANGNAAVVNNAATFDGNGDYVQVASSQMLNASSYVAQSISYFAWVRASPGMAGIMLGQGAVTPPTNGQGWNVRWYSGVAPRCQFGDRSVSMSSVPAYDDEWHFIGCTINFGNQLQMDIYFDGVLNVSTTPGAITSYSHSTNDLRIGRTSGATGNSFNGSIDDAIIYPTYIGPSGVEQVYLAQKAQNGY